MLVNEKKYGINRGGRHTDERGTLYFFNDFDMSEVKRFYRIKLYDTSVVRGWRGHKIEQRWFQVCKGGFEIGIVEVDNWKTPSPFLTVTKFILTEDEDSVLYIPPGFATSLRALSVNSEVIVFADHAIEDAKNDDYLYSSDYFEG